MSSKQQLIEFDRQLRAEIALRLDRGQNSLRVGHNAYLFIRNLGTLWIVVNTIRALLWYHIDANLCFLWFLMLCIWFQDYLDFAGKGFDEIEIALNLQYLHADTKVAITTSQFGKLSELQDRLKLIQVDGFEVDEKEIEKFIKLLNAERNSDLGLESK